MRKIKIEKRGGQQKPTISSKSLVGALVSEAKLQSQLPHNLVPEHHRVEAPRFRIYHVKGDRHGIIAYSPEEFLRQLHTSSRFDNEGTDEEYMVRFAHRLQELEGYLVSTDSPEAFLADLINRGFVTVE